MTAQAEGSLENALQELASLDEQLATPTASGSDEVNNGDAIRRALVVEDNANERELLAGILRMSGFEVDCVEDGLEALGYLKRQRPDAVLLDMRMPRLDGPKTVSAIRCNPDYRGLKLFAVSGGDQSEMGIPIGDHGVNHWFSKPLNPDRLVDRLNRETAGRVVPA